MSETIRISDDQKQWLDQQKLDRFNTDRVSYKVVLEDIIEEVDD